MRIANLNAERKQLLAFEFKKFFNNYILSTDPKREIYWLDQLIKGLEQEQCLLLDKMPTIEY